MKDVPNEVTELALCESEHLILRADQLYRFVAMPGCKRCEELAAVYEKENRKPKPSFRPLTQAEWIVAMNTYWQVRVNGLAWAIKSVGRSGVSYGRLDQMESFEWFAEHATFANGDPCAIKEIN